MPGLLGAVDRAVALALPVVPRAVVARVARPYIAGATLPDALAAVRELNGRGLAATVDVLGESAHGWADAEALAAEYGQLLAALGAQGLDADLSVKPTGFGLDLDPGRAYGLLRDLAAAVEAAGAFVRLDMESSATTDAILELHRRLRTDGVARCGVVLQAMLHRSVADARALAAGEGADVRVCKGIYRESESIAFHDPERVRASYLEICEALLAGGARVAFATHDERLVERVRELVARLGVPREQVCFELLLGVRPDLAERLRADGERVRVYVPFGERWYEYSVRRLRENPRIAGHVLRALVRPPAARSRPAGRSR